MGNHALETPGYPKTLFQHGNCFMEMLTEQSHKSRHFKNTSVGTSARQVTQQSGETVLEASDVMWWHS